MGRLACDDKGNDWKAAIDNSPHLAFLGRDWSTSFIRFEILVGILLLFHQ